MAKKIYWENVKKFAIGLGVPIGVTSFSVLIYYLVILNAISVTSYSGDSICAGNLTDPCVAHINLTANEDVFIYPIGYDPYGRNTPFFTDSALESWKIYRSWGSGWREIKLTDTCTSTWCGAPNGAINNKYSFAFREDKNYTIKIEAYKKDPVQTIKWGFDEVDPWWYGINNTAPTTSATVILMELGSQVNITTNLTGTANASVNIDHPDYRNVHAFGSPNANFRFNISYFRNTLFNNSLTNISLTWNGLANKSIFIPLHAKDVINNLSFNVTGLLTDATYPTNVKIYINNTLSNNLGYVFSGVQSIITFNDSTSITNLTFDKPNTQTKYVRLPKSATVTYAYLNVSGYNNSQFYEYSLMNLSRNVSSSPKIATNKTDMWITDNDSIVSYSINGTYKGGFYGYVTPGDPGAIYAIYADTSSLWLVKRNGTSPYTRRVIRLNQSDFSEISNFAIPTLSYGAISVFNTDIYITCLDDLSVHKYNRTGTFQNNFSTFYYTYFAYNPNQAKHFGGMSDIMFFTNSTFAPYHNCTSYSTFEDGLANGCLNEELNNSVYVNNKTAFRACSSIGCQNFYVGKDIMSISYSNNAFYVINQGLTLVSTNDYVAKFEDMYPTDPYIEVGIFDDNPEWESSGNFSETNDRTNNMSIAINTYLDTCTADALGFCNVPIYFVSSTPGILEASDLNITYSYAENPIVLNKTIAEMYLTSKTGYENLSIDIESSINGATVFSDLKYYYRGGNYTIAVFAWYNSTYTLNSTINLINYYSGYNYTLPRNVKDLEFIPRKSTAYNVTPYGQTPLTPFFNLTMTNYGGKNMNLSIKLSNVSNCVNISINTNSTRQANYTNLSTTWYNVGTNLAYLNNTKIWLWADYGCNSSSWSVWQPDIYLRGCCIGCVCSEDLI